MKITKVNVFTKSLEKGYPALVVTDFVGEKKDKQAFAKRLEGMQ